MQELNFHLDAVVRGKNEISDFDGPLSLILQLLSRNKVAIQDIRISELTEQYLEYLNEMKKMDMELTGEFLTMASYLIYLKSKTLLEGTQAIEEVESLVHSLEEQQRKETLERMKQAAVWLDRRQEIGEKLFVRAAETFSAPPDYLHSHRPEELMAALLDVLSREREEEEERQSVSLPPRLPFSIEEKSEEILILLRDKGSLSLRDLFFVSRSRSEKVATLLAVLELYRGEKLSFREGEDGIILSGYGG